MFNVGDIIGERYVVEEVLGEGAMGLVLGARHRELGQRCAIKVIREDLASDRALVERLQREARAAARLKSHHAVKVYDVGGLASGVPYIVMEYLEGVDLKDYLAARKTLQVVEAVEIVLQACDAIGEAHALGIVHRDLKPANMFITVTPSGSLCIKVVDFGIAKVPEPVGPELTASQVIMGTPVYMAPEQIASSRRVDGRADIWSLGVVLYKLLTGRLPFSKREGMEILVAVLTEQPVNPSVHKADLPSELASVILKCLERDAEKRFQSVLELRAALLPFTEGSAPLSLPTSSRFVPEATVLLPESARRSAPMPRSEGLPSVPDKTAAPVVRTFLLPGDVAAPKVDDAKLDKKVDDRRRRWPVVGLSALAVLLAMSLLSVARFFAREGVPNESEPVGTRLVPEAFSVGDSTTAAPSASDVPPGEPVAEVQRQAEDVDTPSQPAPEAKPTTMTTHKGKAAPPTNKPSATAAAPVSPPAPVDARPAPAAETTASPPPAPPPAPSPTTDPTRVNPVPTAPKASAPPPDPFGDRNP